MYIYIYSARGGFSHTHTYIYTTKYSCGIVMVTACTNIPHTGERKYVFKPRTQEAFFENFNGERVALKRGITYGDSCKKELAAYYLDHQGFAGTYLHVCVM